jgi:hypothetical protein
LRDFSANDKDLSELALEIEKGLSGEGFVLLNVEAQVLLGAGQEIFRRRNWCWTVTAARAACCIRWMVLPVCIHRK